MYGRLPSKSMLRIPYRPPYALCSDSYPSPYTLPGLGFHTTHCTHHTLGPIPPSEYPMLPIPHHFTIHTLLQTPCHPPYLYSGFPTTHRTHLAPDLHPAYHMAYTPNPTPPAVATIHRQTCRCLNWGPNQSASERVYEIELGMQWFVR